MFKKYKWNVVCLVLLVSLAGFLIVNVILYHEIKNYLFEQTFQQMEMKTRLAVHLLEEKNITFKSDNDPKLYDITYKIRSMINSRVTVIDTSGRVLTDSDVARDSVQYMDNHINRPEIQESIQKGWGQGYRRSDTVKRKLFYTAFTLKYQDKNAGFLRLAYYSQNFDQSMRNIITLMISATFIGLSLIFLFALFSGNFITSPILKLVNTAKEISAGDLEKSFTVRGKDEIGTLALILNQLTQQLKTQIQQISDEQKKSEQILNHLDVGIILVDQNKNILHANPAIFTIFEMSPFEYKHVNIIEMIRSEPLIRAIDQVLQKSLKQSDEWIHYTASDKKFLKYRIRPYELAEEKNSGALIQIQDITEIKKLEAIRRDFVANASHELKTPLTSIIGYAETLLHGASEDSESRTKFIRKIREQSQRLEFLIADLLKLSELEREQPIELKTIRLFPILQEIQNDHKEKADEKKINMTLHASKTIKVKADEEGIRTVMNNLIDNAIKYTPRKGQIEIRVKEQNNRQISVQVSDTGIGIDPKYHDRIFQRFYQIDKARSQSLGGTGLGLSIVKHIVEQHGSQIYIESKLGKGSRFWFELNSA